MQTLPKRMRQVVRPCEVVLSERVWEWSNLLLLGAILAQGRANGRGHRAGHGVLGREAVPERSPRPHSRFLVESRTPPPGAGGAGAPVCSRKRASDHGHRGNH
jgi:hypothetical protein